LMTGWKKKMRHHGLVVVVHVNNPRKDTHTI
jgi:hypothetical protein